jgi:hypothetical protein
MDVAVVFESVYGNTRTIAEAIAEGVRESAPAATVTLLPVDAASPDRLAGAGLLLVGGPTHAFGMTRAGTRRDARARATGDLSAATSTGVREWLETLPAPTGHVRAAAFSTRMGSRLAGDAARGITRQLRRAGYDTSEPQGFVVSGAEGPLRDGEAERARAWAAGLVARASQDAARRDGPRSG